MPNLLKLNLAILAISSLALNACSNSTTPPNITPIAGATLDDAATPILISTQAAPSVTLTTTKTLDISPTATIYDTPVISFNLSGGIIGFCDELIISPTGVYSLHTCWQSTEITGNLKQVEVEMLNSWRQNLAGFSLKQEDNPGGVDNMISRLVFNGQGVVEADEKQQGLILDWVNRLLARTRPQPVPSPTPEPMVVGPEGLCAHISRPAVLVIDFDRPGGLILVDPNNQATCNIQLKQPPYGQIVAAAGNIYYPLYDEATKTVTIWQLSSTGEQIPLAFTSVPMEQFGPYHFTVSGDGRKIAWARAIPKLEQTPPLYRNDLWVANLDGSNQVTLLSQAEFEGRYVEPIRFAPDNGTLYYALQPDGLGGGIFSFVGRYDNLYRLPTAGGESKLIFVCPEGKNMICLGDITSDGSTLVYVQPGQGVVILDNNGKPLTTLTPPAADYVGSPVFSPTGNLAFVSATLTQVGQQKLLQANPGTISLAVPPYTSELKTLISNNTVTTAWEWLDENRLIYGRLDPETGATGTAMVTLDGQSTQLSPNFALAVLR